MTGEWFTRQRYLDENSKASGLDSSDTMALHRRYHAQFVNESTKLSVTNTIGLDRLKASTDPHLNDIPLREWDELTHFLPISHVWKEVGDRPSLGGLVCIAKEAARQVLEATS